MLLGPMCLSLEISEVVSSPKAGFFVAYMIFTKGVKSRYKNLPEQIVLILWPGCIDRDDHTSHHFD